MNCGDQGNLQLRNTLFTALRDNGWQHLEELSVLIKLNHVSFNILIIYNLQILVQKLPYYTFDLGEKNARTHKIHIAYRSFRDIYIYVCVCVYIYIYIYIYIYGLLLQCNSCNFKIYLLFNVCILWMLRIPKNKLLNLQLHVVPTKQELPEKKNNKLNISSLPYRLGYCCLFHTLSGCVIHLTPLNMLHYL